MHLLLFDKKNNYKFITIKSIVLSAAALTTFSSVGLVVLAVLIFAYFLQNQDKIKRIIPLLVVVAVFGIAMIGIPTLRSGIIYAFNKATSSLDVRTFGFTSGFIVFVQNPIFGAGYSGATSAMNDLYNLNGLTYNQTSTTFSSLAMFGFGFTLVITFGFLKFFYVVNVNLKKIVLFIILIAMFISMNNERFIFNFTFYTFCLYGLSVPLFKGRYKAKEDTPLLNH